MNPFNRLKANLRYAAGVRGFLREPLTGAAAREMIERQLAGRNESFLQIMQRGVYANARSPYLKLLQHAGIGLEDIRRMVKHEGLEATLSRLYDADVRLTQEEFKGRRPVVRGSLQFLPRTGDFDNPLLTAAYEGRTSGSTGPGSRALIDFDLLKHEAAHFRVLSEAHASSGQPVAIWRPGPPDSGGLKSVFWYTKSGRTPEIWFTPNRFVRSAEGLRAAVILNLTLHMSRLAGNAIPRPSFVPSSQVGTVIDWLSAKIRGGDPATLVTNASNATRLCLAAKHQGADLGGTVFEIVGEPLTAAKARAISEAGGRAINRYGMVEVGNVGLGCADPLQVDDLHILTDKVALWQKELRVSRGPESVLALICTTVLPSCPKIMLNVETGDYGTLTQRKCSCALGKAGFSTHLTGLRSYEKVTSEGVTFLGIDLYALVEEELPARFGGYPTDYQLVEEEDEEGRTYVSVLVSPNLGPIDEEAVASTVLSRLAQRPGGPLMTEIWRQGRTLKVVRRQPHATSTAKVLPLRMLGIRPAQPADVGRDG